MSGFEFTSESGLFDLLSIGLYHGWLADPQDVPTWNAVSGCSYNQLVEKVITDRQSSDSGKVHEGKCIRTWMQQELLLALKFCVSCS